MSLMQRATRATLLALALFATSATASDYQLETLAENLHHPWSVARLPGGDFLVTERRGRLLRIPGTGGPTITLSGVPETYVAGQGGYFDVVLHPAFASNRLVYLSYAEGPAQANGTAVVRGRLTAGGLSDVETVLRVQDRKDRPQHYGGRMLFLPDHTLLVATGDGFDDREEAQNLGSELGKVLRVTDSGGVPADNPFVDGPRPKVWTYGHRNTQGLALDPNTGTVYLHEHGPRGGDELNRLTPGRNYGWPIISYGLDYTGAYVTPYTEMEGMQQPLHYWTPSIAPSGMARYSGDRFPAWRNNLFVGALVDKEVRRLELADGGVVRETPVFAELGERIRDVYSGDDGYLYLLTDSEQGKLVRVRPAAGTAPANAGG